MRRNFMAVFATTFAMMSSTPGGATVFRPYDLTSQVRDSDLVFEGTVEIVFACPSPEGDMPRTCALVAVERFIKGERATSHVTLVVPGGMAANGTYVQMVGAPTLSEGETVLVSTFLTPDPQGLVGLVNFGTALLRKHETKDGKAVAMNAHSRVLRALPRRGLALSYAPFSDRGEPDEAEQPLSWSAARRAIEDAVANSK